MTIHEIWSRVTSTRYTRAREASERMDSALKDEVMRLRGEVARQGAEVDRLRAENRALLNSILGIAGIPPIPATSADVPPPGHLAPTPGPSSSQSRCAGGPRRSRRFQGARCADAPPFVAADQPHVGI